MLTFAQTAQRRHYPEGVTLPYLRHRPTTHVPDVPNNQRVASYLVEDTIWKAANRKGPDLMALHNASKQRLCFQQRDRLSKG